MKMKVEVWSDIMCPFCYIGKRKLKVREGGVLADVAPTMLELMGLEKPEEMTGHSILVAE